MAQVFSIAGIKNVTVTVPETAVEQKSMEEAKRPLTTFRKWCEDRWREQIRHAEGMKMDEKVYLPTLFPVTAYVKNKTA